MEGDINRPSYNCETQKNFNLTSHCEHTKINNYINVRAVKFNAKMLKSFQRCFNVIDLLLV